MEQNIALVSMHSYFNLVSSFSVYSKPVPSLKDCEEHRGLMASLMEDSRDPVIWIRRLLCVSAVGLVCIRGSGISHL